MNTPEPIDFLQERRVYRSGEEESVSSSQPESTAQESKMGLRCSCCGFSGDHVKVVLDAGRGILLCDRCVEVCNDILCDKKVATDALPVESKKTSFSRYQTKYHCSFCLKEQRSVGLLIAMLNDLFICNGCVGACNLCIAQASIEEVVVEK